MPGGRAAASPTSSWGISGKSSKRSQRLHPPCVGAGSQPGRDTAGSSPSGSCEVRYKEWTDEGLLRHPVFLRVARRQGARGLHPPDGPSAPPEDELGVAAATPSVEERNVVLTNQDKVFWPEERYTKGDLVEYYRAISPWLLPYLSERPVVLTRFPDGINGKSFYQKDAPAFTPDWLRTERMWSEATQREIDYFVVDDVPRCSTWPTWRRSRCTSG